MIDKQVINRPAVRGVVAIRNSGLATDEEPSCRV